eukprot:TRINITY_DN101021_c0_g1_i1.p1 TRINITY_DN101021_c0_g1~~TRINITY_DN101021_c0_g1_i1.p1  ORF type:complete len:116 (+),score=11.66 TRINITY_DN101021_c0_g1_i1:121-468(+)
MSTMDDASSIAASPRTRARRTSFAPLEVVSAPYQTTSAYTTLLHWRQNVENIDVEALAIPGGRRNNAASDGPIPPDLMSRLNPSTERPGRASRGKAAEDESSGGFLCCCMMRDKD